MVHVDCSLIPCSIAFVCTQKIHKSPILSGTPLLICRYSGGRGKEHPKDVQALSCLVLPLFSLLTHIQYTSTYTHTLPHPLSPRLNLSETSTITITTFSLFLFPLHLRRLPLQILIYAILIITPLVASSTAILVIAFVPRSRSCA
jgi:hypothetical protein